MVIHEHADVKALVRPIEAKFSKSRSALGTRFGGSAWESNPPGTGTPPHNGFEDREAHQDLSTPAVSYRLTGHESGVKDPQATQRAGVSREKRR